MTSLCTTFTVMLSAGQTMTIGEDADGYWLEVQNGEEAIEARVDRPVAEVLAQYFQRLPGLREDRRG